MLRKKEKSNIIALIQVILERTALANWLVFYSLLNTIY